MSLEQVLLITFLVVLPLMQYLVKYLRRQNELREQTEGRPPSPRRTPEYEEQSPLPRAAYRTEPDAIPAHAPTSLSVLAAARSAPPATPVALRGGRIDLRRAIVLMTVVGPCRAASPDDRAGP
jgi:hypothetical protein